MFQPINQHLQAGGEPLLAVVDPDVLAQGDQGWEAVGGQRAEELVQLGSDRRVADPLLVDGGTRAAGRKADGVVHQQEKRQAGLAVTEPGRLQRRKERLGQGQGVGSQRVAGLEDGGDAGMGLEHLTQSMGEELELVGPGLGGVEVAVNLGQDAVKDQVVELLLVADVVVDRAGGDSQAGGQAAHGQGLGAVLGDDRQGLGDHALAGELGAAVLVVGGTIQGERHFAHDSSEQHFHRVERRYGAFRRSITLPAHVMAEGIEALVDNGVLQILVPKMEEATAKRIKVRPGRAEVPAASRSEDSPPS
jgi:Hsp20/alpha crystallin family